MTKKELGWVVLAVGLLALYVIFFTDWFKKKTIHISHTVRPLPQAMRLSATTGAMITFGFDHPLRLKEVSVVPLLDWETNHYAEPLWHLVSESNSIPVRFFVYGSRIRGMKPAIPGLNPEPLDTNVIYRLFVTAGKLSGQHDFEIGPPGAAIQSISPSLLKWPPR